MKKFILKMIIYMFPFVVLISPFFYVGIKSKEIYDFDKIIEIQNQSESMMLGMGYNEQTHYYKYKNANMLGAEVLALGTSRVMQIKESYFSVPFYNCGGAVSSNFDEYLNFMKSLDEDAMPHYLILGLDSWIFNDNWNCELEYSEDHQITKNKVNAIGIIKKIMEDYLSNKWTFQEFFEGYQNIGFNGIIKGNGYKKDGSYYYTDIYLNPEKQQDYNFANTLKRVEIGNSRFAFGSEIDSETLLFLDDLLGFCRKNQIEVVAFIPPFAPSVIDRMEEGGNHTYLAKVAPSVQEIFDVYGYEFYDFTDVRFLECDDSFFIDGFHGSEVLYGIMIQKICESNSNLQFVIDQQKLNRMILDRYSNLTFYDVAEE